MAETLAYNFVGNDELSRVFEALDRVANKLDRTFNQLGDQATQAGRKLGTAGAEAKGAGDELKGTGEAAEKAARKIDELGDDMDKAALKAAVFDAQIRQAKRSVRELTDEFAKTGDVDVLKKLGNSQGNLAALEKLKKDLSKALGEAGTEGGEGFFSNLTKEFTRFAVNPAALGSPLVAGIVLAAPAIGAATGAAVSLGLGAAVLAGGILAAAKDSRVSDAWGTMLKGAGDEFKSQSTVLVDPLVQSAAIVGAAFGRVIPKIGADFATLAPRITSIADGAGKMVENIFKGGNFDRAIALSGALMDKLSLELPNLGNAVSDMVGSVADSGPGVQQFWSDFLTGTEKAVVGVGNLVEALSKTYDFLGGEKSIGKRINDSVNNDIAPALDKAGRFLDNNIGKKINDFFGQGNRINSKPVDDLTDSTKKLKDEQDRAAAAAAAHDQALSRLRLGATLSAADFSKFSSQISATVTSTDVLAGKMTDKLMGSLLGMGHATLGVAESLTSIKDTFDQNGRAIDKHTGLIAMNTQAGQRNREAVLSAVEANLRQYDAQIASGMSAQDAAAKYGENTKALHDQLRQAGLTEAQIHDLIGEYGNVPAKVNTDIATHGLTTAITNLDALIRRLNGIPTSRDIYITEHVNQVIHGGQSPDRLFDYPGLAYGGRAGKRAMGGAYDVGENGPERVILPDGAYVIPNNQMSRGSGPEVLDAVDVPLRLRDSVTGDVVVNALLRLSKQRGRTVAQLLQIA